MDDIKDSREELYLFKHTLETMQMGDDTERLVLVRNGDEVKCPEATRILMPVSSGNSIQTSDNQIQQYGIAETPCGSHCAKFNIKPEKDGDGKNTGGIVATLGCIHAVYSIHNKRLPEKREAKEVKMEVKEESAE